MKLLAPLRWLYLAYALILFLVLMIPVFIWSAIVVNFGRIRGGNLVYRACYYWSKTWCTLIFIRHRNYYEQRMEKGKAYIFVANHNSYLDAAMIPQVVRRPIRALGKEEMSKIPVFGFIYKYAIVTVNRSSVQGRAKSVYYLKSIIKKGISILVFPEGTFNMSDQPLADFFDGAFRIAIETQTPIKPVLFLDTYDRLHYRSIFSLNPGRSRAVFLPEVSVAGLRNSDTAALKKQVKELMAERLIAYRASWINDGILHPGKKQNSDLASL